MYESGSMRPTPRPLPPPPPPKIKEKTYNIELTAGQINFILGMSYEIQKTYRDYLKNPLCHLKPSEKKEVMHKLSIMSELDTSIVDQIPAELIDDDI